MTQDQAQNLIRSLLGDDAEEFGKLITAQAVLGPKPSIVNALKDLLHHHDILLVYAPEKGEGPWKRMELRVYQYGKEVHP